MEKLPKIMRNKELMLAVGAYTMHNWELYGMWAWYSDFAKVTLLEVEGATANCTNCTLPLSATQAQKDGSLIDFFAVASGFLLCIAAGKAEDHYGRTLVCILSLAVSAFCSLLAGYAQSRAGLWALAIYGA
jgi:hypothetical protein